MVPGKPLAFRCSSVAFVEWMPDQARHDGDSRVIAGLTRNPFMRLLDCIRKAWHDGDWRSGLGEVVLQEGFERNVVGALDFVLFFD